MDGQEMRALVDQQENGPNCTFCHLDCGVFTPPARLIHELAHVRTYVCTNCQFTSKTEFAAREHQAATLHVTLETYHAPIALRGAGFHLRRRWGGEEAQAEVQVRGVDYNHGLRPQAARELRFDSPSTTEYDGEDQHPPRPELRFPEREARINIHHMDVERPDRPDPVLAWLRGVPEPAAPPQPDLRQRAIDIVVTLVHLLFDIMGR